MQILAAEMQMDYRWTRWRSNAITSSCGGLHRQAGEYMAIHTYIYGHNATSKTMRWHFENPGRLLAQFIWKTSGRRVRGMNAALTVKLFLIKRRRQRCHCAAFHLFLPDTSIGWNLFMNLFTLHQSQRPCTDPEVVNVNSSDSDWHQVMSSKL